VISELKLEFDVILIVGLRISNPGWKNYILHIWCDI
jgi:hypothetical protein